MSVAGEASPCGLVSLGVFARAVRESLQAPEGPEPGAKLREALR
jgi:hypothetical protein